MDTEGQVQVQAQAQAKANSSFLNAMFNGLNAMLGIGIISVPYALAAGGWCSLLLLLTVSVTTFYTGLLIQRIMELDPSLSNYQEIGYRAFGRVGQVVVLISTNLELFLVAAGFIIMEGDNLSILFPSVHLSIHGIHISGEKCFSMMVAAVILPTTWFRNMNILSYVSATGVLASLVIVGSILWVGAVDGVGFKEKGRTINWEGMPSAACLYLFCFSAHPVFPSLYNSMKKKNQFSKVLLLCFVLCTIMYASMAVAGYLMFGENANSQITMNLPTNKTSSKVAIFTILVNPIAKYALLVTPIVETIEEQFQTLRRRSFSILTRTTLVICTLIVALAFPFFGLLMSLVGALLNATVSIILPSLFYLKISGNYKVIGPRMIIIGFVVIMGIVIAIAGTYTSIADITRKK